MNGTLPQLNKPRRPVAFIAFSLILVFLIASLTGLGVWQVHRLAWKEDLIARVDARVHADPVVAPSRSEWSQIDGEKDEYRKVSATGTFDHSHETLVFASTQLGAGYWVMTPLHVSDGTTILINRGFIPSDKRDAATRLEGNRSGTTTIIGLLRLTEPKGTLLKSNVPNEDRWYSRDIAAIAAKRDLKDVAPYFIDADATPNPGGYPVGGLTVISFPNNHLVYAITWFAMAIMCAGMLIYLTHHHLIRRHEPGMDDS
ncbi:SURF1 family protein [Oryzifoliimicrobium ureilyticus]|uniref:SURF1 family protein n=1 Tax=Oryzifoliimicrobium ureilyticus TaxID=3113724 RepID=UPI003075EE4D